MKSKRTVFLFVNHYPYSTQENFLDDELPVLARHFDKIVITPMCGRGAQRNVPSNCLVTPPLNLTSNRLQYIRKGLFSFRSFPLLLRDFFRNHVVFSRLRLRSWISSGLQYNNLLKSKTLNGVLSEISEDDIIYSYWGTDLIKVALINKNCKHIVSRFHGAWDLWEESYGGFFPLRTEVLKRLEKAIFISKKGELYFKNKYPHCETAYFPLGTKDYGQPQFKNEHQIINVVSCSTVYPLKRVPLIFKSLNESGFIRIHWTHFGGGLTFESLKGLVEDEKKEHLEVDLRGQVDHEEVIDYYKHNKVHAFINLSESEGVPVSIMEAMSFDIPIIATDVGSTSEEVTNRVGILVSSNPTTDEVSMALARLITSFYSPRVFWEEHYNADVNYEKFATMLANL